MHEEGCTVAWQFDEYDLFTFACDHNLFWHDGKQVGVEVRIAADPALETMSLERWRLRGFDRNSPVADPGFADPERDRYELRADSPAFALGFAPIPVDRIGLMVDEHRRVVPARPARERRELLFARMPSVMQLQALRRRRPSPAVTAPPPRLVEGDALAIAGSGPKYRHTVAVAGEMAVRNGDQRAADSRTPVRLVHEDAVQFADRRIHRIAARADAGAPDDRARELRDPPPVRDRPSEIPPPARHQLRRNRAIRLRQQFAEGGIPRIDVDAHDNFGVRRRHRPDGEP